MPTPLSSQDLALFAEQLAALVRTELPLAPAVREVGRNLGSPRGRAAIAALAGELDKGVKLSDALAQQPNTFPPLFAALIDAGEKSGTLPSVLSELAILAKNQFRYRRAILDALAYPLFVFLFALFLICILLKTVSQQVIEAIIELSDGAPPTAWFPKIALFCAQNFFPLGAAFCGLIVILLLVWLTLRQTSPKTVARFWWRLPVLGAVVQNFALTHWTKLLCILVKHGVPLEKALLLTSQSSPNLLVSLATDTLVHAVKGGQKFSDALSQQKLFPQFLGWLILSGEQQNQLAEALAQAAESYEERAQASIRFLERNLQPLLITAIGLLVALAIVLVLSPVSVLVSIATELLYRGP